jgi:hypothetical protein
MAADPVQITVVFLVFWIRDRFEELCIAAGASDVLRWAAVRPATAVNKRRGDVSIWDLLLYLLSGRRLIDIMPAFYTDPQEIDALIRLGCADSALQKFRARA